MKEELLVKQDCINYEKEQGYCRGLKQLFCSNSRWCPFYKSESEYDMEGYRKQMEVVKA